MTLTSCDADGSFCAAEDNLTMACAVFVVFFCQQASPVNANIIIQDCERKLAAMFK